MSSSGIFRMIRPFVINGIIDAWPARQWTPETLAKLLKDKMVKIRLGSKKHFPGTVQWETMCKYVDCTIDELLSWGSGNIDNENPMSAYNYDEHWAYVDYKYMFELFDESELKAVDWSLFGLDGRDGLDSTFWLGTQGAYTPCHYDTYGFNLVAQLYGEKRWVLFPPDDDLGATRIPYEESSVFATYDLICPENTRMENCHPHRVILKPGDVLFVPPKWWHFVQSNSPWTISVNTWVDIPELDAEIKPLEALTKVVFSLLSDIVSDNIVIDNRENQLDHVESLHILNSVQSAINADKTTKPKRQKTEAGDMNEFVQSWRNRSNEVEQLAASAFCKEAHDNCLLKRQPPMMNDDDKWNEVDLLAAMTHPQTIKTIYDVLRTTDASDRRKALFSLFTSV